MVQKTASSFFKPHLRRIVATVSWGRQSGYSTDVSCFSSPEQNCGSECIESGYEYGSSLSSESGLGSGSRVLMTKNWRKQYSRKFFLYLLDQQLQFTSPLPKPPWKDVQAPGEAFRPQKRTSSTLKNEIYELFFLCLLVIFALLDPDPDCESGFGYGSRDPIEYGNTDPIRIRIADPDTDPGTLLKPDNIRILIRILSGSWYGSGSTTLLLRLKANGEDE